MYFLSFLLLLKVSLSRLDTSKERERLSISFSFVFISFSPWKSITLLELGPKFRFQEPLRITCLGSSLMDGCKIQTVNDTILVTIIGHFTQEPWDCFFTAILIIGTLFKINRISTKSWLSSCEPIITIKLIGTTKFGLVTILRWTLDSHVTTRGCLWTWWWELLIKDVVVVVRKWLTNHGKGFN